MKISKGNSKGYEGTGLAVACINIDSRVDAIECNGGTITEAEVIRDRVFILLQNAEDNSELSGTNAKLTKENSELLNGNMSLIEQNAELKGKILVSEECCTNMGNELERVNGLLARKSEQEISDGKRLSKLVIEAKYHKQQLAEAHEILGRTIHRLDKTEFT